MNESIKLFAGNSNKKLAEDIASNLGVNLGDCEVSRFADDEVKVRINESIRGKDVFLIQPTCSPVNDSIMEALVFIDALKRASAGRITLVVPYFAYARQDYKANPRDPISAKLVAKMIEAAGANRAMVADIHSLPIQGFFEIPVDNLRTTKLFYNYIKGKKLTDLVVVAPDAGAAKRAKKFAARFDADVAVINKFRPKENVAEVTSIIGDVKGKNCVVVDDMVDTAGSITVGSKALKDSGAKDIYVCASHPVLSGPAIERIEKSEIKELVVTDTIPLGKKKIPKIKVLSIAEMIAQAIKVVHGNKSMTKIY